MINVEYIANTIVAADMNSKDTKQIMQTELVTDGFIREVDDKYPTDIIREILKCLTECYVNGHVKTTFICDVNYFKHIVHSICPQFQQKRLFDAQKLLEMVEEEEIDVDKFDAMGRKEWKMMLTETYSVCRVGTSYEIRIKIHKLKVELESSGSSVYLSVLHDEQSISK